MVEIRLGHRVAAVGSGARSRDHVDPARAVEAERAGLVSRVVPAADLVDEAIRVAQRIAAFSGPVAMMAKEAVNAAYETTLAEGVRFERRLAHSTFAIEDQKEGMAAFAEKRQPVWKNR